MRIGNILARVIRSRAAPLAIGCLIGLWPQPAAARPIFTTEHNWTINLGESTFGLRQEAILGAGDESYFQYTRVYCGPYVFHVRIRATSILAGIAAIVAGIAVFQAVLRIRWPQQLVQQEEVPL